MVSSVGNYSRLTLFFSGWPSETTVFFFLSLCEFLFAGLSRYRKFRENSRQQIHTFVEGGQRNPLIISVHPPEVLIGQRERKQAVGLHVVQPQLGGIGRSRGLKRQNGCVRELSLSNSYDCGIKIRLQGRRRSREPRVRLDFKTDLRIIYELGQIGQKHVDGISRQQANVQDC